MTKTERLTADDIRNWSDPKVQKHWVKLLSPQQRLMVIGAELRCRQEGTNAQVEANALNWMFWA